MKKKQDGVSQGGGGRARLLLFEQEDKKKKRRKKERKTSKKACHRRTLCRGRDHYHCSAVYAFPMLRQNSGVSVLRNGAMPAAFLPLHIQYLPLRFDPRCPDTDFFVPSCEKKKQNKV